MIQAMAGRAARALQPKPDHREVSPMLIQSKTILFGEETEATPFRDAALPILIGGAAGLGTGALIWIMAVIRFGLQGWFWP